MHDSISSSSEITQIIYGQDNAMKKLMEVMARVEREALVCADSMSPAFSMGVEPIKQGYVNFKKRGVKIKFITEVTYDNIAYVKELMQFAEVRHLDSVKGNIAISERDYVATAALEGAKPVTQTIYSNAKAILEQNRYFFDNLWGKAIPAEQRILELEQKRTAEKTDVAYGIESATATIVQFLSNASKRIDICADRNWPSVAMGIPVFQSAMADLTERKSPNGQPIACRFITEMTVENLPYCKELMKIAEVRHLEVRGNLAVSEHEYIASAIMRESELLQQVIYSNTREIVEQQQFLFDTLWNKAIRAEERIKEIEEGVIRRETKVLRDPERIIQEVKRVIASSKEYSAVSVPEGILWAYNYIFDVLKEVLERSKYGEHTGIKMVTRIDRNNLDVAKIFLDLGIQIRHISSVPSMTFGVSDKEVCATVEKIKGASPSQNGLFSTEPLYVNHFHDIFEDLWNDGVDATERIREIELGQDEQFVQLFINPERAAATYVNMAQSVKTSALLLLPSSKAFVRQSKLGLFAYLTDAVQKHKAQIRIICIKDENNAEIIDALSKMSPYIQILDTNTNLDSTVFIVNNEECFTAEVRRPDAETFTEAISFALYSNSKPSVHAFTSFFDALWHSHELNARLKKTEELQREFINIAAHEFRTPVQPILALSEMLEDELTDNKEDIRMIARNARRLQQLTEDILEVARIESQALTLSKTTFDVNELILDVVHDHQRHLSSSNDNRGIKIVYTPVEAIHVQADRGRIAQVVSNLLSNAVKFTEEGAVAVIVERDTDVITVSVKDAGRGIDPQIKPRLFTKFASKSGIGGTGLGLYISKSIVEAHGGKIWAGNNENGKGATFSFSLPIQPLSDKASSNEDQEPPQDPIGKLGWSDANG